MRAALRKDSLRLDETDRRILRAMQRDARLTTAELADHVADRARADGIKQMLSQPPRQSLTPSQRHQRRLIAPSYRRETRPHP